MGLRERNRKLTELRIEDVATAMFLDRGVDAVTLEEICEEAGVSRRTFFNYFESKDQVITGATYPKVSDEVLQAICDLPSEEEKSFPFRTMRLVGHDYLCKHRQLLHNTLDPELTQTIMNRRARLIKSSPQLMLTRMRAFEAIRERLRDSIACNLENNPNNRCLEQLPLREEVIFIVNMTATLLWSTITFANQTDMTELKEETLTKTVQSMSILFRGLETLDFRSQ